MTRAVMAQSEQPAPPMSQFCLRESSSPLSDGTTRTSASRHWAAGKEPGRLGRSWLHGPLSLCSFGACSAPTGGRGEGHEGRCSPSLAPKTLPLLSLPSLHRDVFSAG